MTGNHDSFYGEIVARLTDAALAERLTKVAHDVRAFGVEPRKALLLEAASRLEADHDAPGGEA